ncbi:hypothetical protein BH23CHL8_BH23CHL8_31380 [soil metagenome]
MPTQPAVPLRSRQAGETTSGRFTATQVLAATGAVLAITSLSVLPLLTPWFTHPALDLARSASWLGVDPTVAQDLSDRSIHELVFGPGTFALIGPDSELLYDAAERGHLADARLLLGTALLAGATALLAVGLSLWRSDGDRRATLWRAVSLGGLATSLGAVGLGMAGILAFGPLFELFHQVFFPGGNWAFDPTRQRLVQLYPMAFWQVAAGAFGMLTTVLGLGAWLLGRSMAARAIANPDSAA